MLKELKFVQGAVAKDDSKPALTHFNIKEGVITGFNGVIQLSSPIDVNIDIYPNAKQLVRAITTCTDAISLQLSANKSKLIVQSKNFKTHVDCLPTHSTPYIVPDGQLIQVPANFIELIKTAHGFIAEDNRHAWACGLLLKDQSIYATNNLVIIQLWLGCTFPFPINIPLVAIKELIRINENPLYIKVTDRHITFKFENERFLTSALLVHEWPDVDKFFANTDVRPAVIEGLFDAIDKITKFTDERGDLHFFGDKITTSKDWLNTGTVIDLPGAPSKGCYCAKSLRLLKGVATAIDFESYPKPSIFYGESVRGMLIGLLYHD